MFVIVGLGNIGDKYTHTRHNAGRIALASWITRRDASFVSSKKYHGEVAELVVHGEKVLALLPATYMNQSGGPVAKAVTSKKSAEKLIVLHDDLDLPLGTIRISYARGSGGHNGVRSIAQSIHTEDFVRVRIGISPVVRGAAQKPKGEEKVLAWVMGEFKKAEDKILEVVSNRIGDALETLITEGREVAMNRFN